MSDNGDRDRVERSTISGIPYQPVYTPETTPIDYEADLGDPGQLPVHPRRVRDDVPRQAVDDAPVRGLRHGGGDEPAVPLPVVARADGPVDRLRHAHADGLRLRPPAVAGRGRPGGRGGRHAGRHGGSVRRHPARPGDHLDDRQRAGRGRARAVRVRGRAPGRAAREAGRHDPGGHPQGVHRPEGVDLPGRALDAADDRHDRVVHGAHAALASGVDLRVPHPRGGGDGRPGAGVHARRRLRLRRAVRGARHGRRRVRAAAVVLLQRPHRLLRGDREVPGRAADLGARAAEPVRREAASARC